MSLNNKVMVRDPDSRKDYPWDWSEWLVDGEVISDASFIADPGINIYDQDQSDTSVTAWIEGGEVGVDYKVTCRIVTNQGRTDDRTRIFKTRNL